MNEQMNNVQPKGHPYPPYFDPGMRPVDLKSLERASLLLRISGWFYIVGSAILGIFFLIFLFGIAAFFNSQFYNPEMMQDLPPLPVTLPEFRSFGSVIILLIAIIVLLLLGFSIWLGIILLKHHRDEKFLTFFFVVSIIYTGFGLVSLLSDFSLSNVIGLATSVVFLLGAIFKRKAYGRL